MFLMDVRWFLCGRTSYKRTQEQVLEDPDSRNEAPF